MAVTRIKAHRNVRVQMIERSRGKRTSRLQRCHHRLTILPAASVVTVPQKNHINRTENPHEIARRGGA